MIMQVEHLHSYQCSNDSKIFFNQSLFSFVTGPPTPTAVNVSMAMNNTVAGLFVSWDVDQELYGSIQYHVISDQNLTCNSISSSCTLWVAGCGQTHSIQVTASNEAGPSQPSNPVFFTTCACSFTDCYILLFA